MKSTLPELILKIPRGAERLRSVEGDVAGLDSNDPTGNAGKSWDGIGKSQLRVTA